MELKILEKTDTDLRVKIVGETHSLLNLLKNELIKDEHVDLATYDIKHVTMGDPVLFVRTVAPHDPIDAVIRASERIRQLCEEFRTTLNNTSLFTE